MKRIWVLGMCAVLLLVQLFSGVTVYAAGNIAIMSRTITDSSGKAISSISEGSNIKVTLNCQNKSGESISDISAGIDSDSAFYGTNANTFTAEPAGSVGHDGTFTVNLLLTYKGTGNDLKYTIKYKDGTGYKSEAQSLYIKEASPTDNTPPSNPDTSKYVPKLVATKSATAFTATAGTSNKLVLPIKNTSMYAARTVAVTLEMEDKAKATQVLDTFELIQNFDQVASNETRNAVFDLKIMSSAPEGMYAFKLNYTFTNFYDSNNTFNASETVYVKVVNGNTTPRLIVESIETNPTVAIPGENVELKVKIGNIGSLTAKNIKVTLKGLKNGGFITNNSTDVKFVPSIGGKGSAVVAYALKATAGIPSGSNELQVKIEYSDENGSAPQTEENQIFIPVNRTGAGKGLAIQSIQSPQGAISVNKDFKVSFTLVNTGLTDLSNIKVSLTTDKEIICKSMNNIMVDTLGKGQSKKFEYTLYAAQEATTKNYPVAINVEYGEAQGDTPKASVSQYVGLYVENGATGKSVPRIIIDKYSYEPSDIKAGDEFTLKMSFLNTSRAVNISNLKITVSSDDGTFTPINSSNTFFIDSMPSKKSINESLVLKAKPGVEPKAYALSVNLEYEDDKGNPYTTKETISIPVSQAPRFVTGDINMSSEAFANQPFPVSIEFYNMGKTVLYNLLVKAEGDFTAQNGRYFVGNFESGRSDSFEVQVIPKAPGEMKGAIVFTFEDATGKIIEVKKDFTTNVIEMPMEQPPVGMEGMGPDGKPFDPNAPKGFNILYVAIPGGVLVLGMVLFIVIRKKRIKRRELSLDE